MNSELVKILAAKGFRVTKPRDTVFNVLHTSAHPLEIGDIARKCPAIDRVSVYRTIELFTQLGIAAAVPLGWKQRYELTDPFKAHHHHLHCSQCGKLIDIHSQKLEQLVAAITSDYGFTPQEHKFEVSGLCQDCKTS